MVPPPDEADAAGLGFALISTKLLLLAIGDLALKLFFISDFLVLMGLSTGTLGLLAAAAEFVSVRVCEFVSL